MGRAQRTRRALDILKEEVLNNQRFVFFRIDLRDRAAKPEQYQLVASLMDVRLIHLLSASVSAGHEVGQKSEAYLIDLSQYSAERLMRGLNLLEFKKKQLVLKETTGKTMTGENPRKLVGPLAQSTAVPTLLARYAYALSAAPDAVSADVGPEKPRQNASSKCRLKLVSESQCRKVPLKRLRWLNLLSKLNSFRH